MEKVFPASIRLLAFLLAATAFAVDPNCEQSFDALIAKAPSGEAILSQISSLDEKINAAYSQILREGGSSQRALLQEHQALKAKVDAYFEELSHLELHDRQGHQVLEQKIRASESDLRALEDSIQHGRVAVISPQPNREKKLAVMESFDEIKAMKGYTVRGNGAQVFTAYFTPRALKELYSTKVDPRVRQAILQALKNGIVPPTGSRGIKIAKTGYNTPFAEIKPMGSVAGYFRVFGCVEDGEIIFHFLGHHMESANDPQQLYIRKLCSK